MAYYRKPTSKRRAGFWVQRDLLVEVVHIVMLAASLLVQPFLVKADRTLLVDVVT